MNAGLLHFHPHPLQQDQGAVGNHGAGREDRGGAHLAQDRLVIGRDDAADDDENVVASALAEPVVTTAVELVGQLARRRIRGEELRGGGAGASVSAPHLLALASGLDLRRLELLDLRRGSLLLVVRETAALRFEFGLEP